MACRRVQRVVFLWVDRERESGIADPVARHLEECPNCRDRAVEVERLILWVRTRCPRTAAPSRLGERIRTLLEGE
jgi:predicted anti-sigma-YlaC factor YlaD